MDMIGDLWAKRPKLVIAVGLAIAFVLYWHYLIQQQTVRFRLTIEIETPEGVKSASSVIEAYLPTSQGRGLNPVGYGGQHRGVSPIVDLGEKGVLAVSLFGRDLPDFDPVKDGPLDAWRLPLEAWNISLAIKPVDLSPIRGSGPVQLTSTRQPLLIWIENPNANAPLVVTPLLPRQMWWVLGKGYAIRGIFLEPTSDTLVEKIPNPPKWLSAVRPRPRVITRGPKDPLRLTREKFETAPIDDALRGEHE